MCVTCPLFWYRNTAVCASSCSLCCVISFSPGWQTGPVGFGRYSHSNQLALSGTVQDTLPPVDCHPPTTPPLAQPIHDNPELMCVIVSQFSGENGFSFPFHVVEETKTSPTVWGGQQHTAVNIKNIRQKSNDIVKKFETVSCVKIEIQIVSEVKGYKVSANTYSFANCI